MNTIKTCFRISIAFSFLIICFDSQAQPIGTIQKAIAQKKSASVIVNPNSLAKSTRHAVQYVPFETPPGATPNTLISFPNGKSMPVTEYVTALNGIERRLNQDGYSLRISNTPQKLIETRIDATRLRQQRDFISSKHTLKGALPPLALNATNEARKDYFTGVYKRSEQQTAARKYAASRAAANLHTSESWDLPMGDQSSFYADLNGALNLDGTFDACQLSASSKATISVFGVSADVVDASCSLNGPKTGNTTADLSVSFAGMQLVSVADQNPTGAIVNQYELTIPLEASFSLFAETGLPITITVGSNVDAGVDYALTALPLSVSMDVTPYVKSDVYAEAGLDLLFAGVSVGVDLTLLNDNLAFHSLIEVRTENGAHGDGQTYLYDECSAYNDILALSGNVYVDFWIYYPCCSWHWPDFWNDCSLCEWNGYYSLWAWQPPISSSGYLFNEKHTTQTAVLTQIQPGVFRPSFHGTPLWPPR